MKKNSIVAHIIIISCVGAFSVAADISKKLISTEKVKLVLARPSIKDTAVGVFKAMEALKCSPLEQCSVWDQNYLERDAETKDIINRYLAGEYGQKVKKLTLANKNKKEIVELLIQEGFVLEKSDSSVDHALRNNKDSQPQDRGEIYIHTDGSIVRIKNSSSTRRIRPQAYVVKAILRDLKSSASWRNEAFKVTNEGVPIPKGPKQLQGLRVHAPDSSGVTEDKGWVDLIMEEGHINILPDEVLSSPTSSISNEN